MKNKFQTKLVLKRSEVNLFNFKDQCFYCKEPCFRLKKKHGNRKNFKMPKKDTKIYVKMLELFKS